MHTKIRQKQAQICYYYDNLDGRWSLEKAEYLQKEMEDNQELILQCEEKMQQDVDIIEQNYYYELQKKALIKQEAIQEVQQEASRLEALEQEGKEAYFINPYGYQAIFQRSILNANKQLLPGMLILVLLSGAVCAYENQAKAGTDLLLL